VDVTNVTWSANALEGSSDVVPNDPYEIVLTEPAGYSLTDARLIGAQLVSSQKDGAVRTIRLRSSTGRVQWRLEYRRDGRIDVRGFSGGREPI
jgi:hypothetical protein